jgi:hypothetical protein
VRRRLAGALTTISGFGGRILLLLAVTAFRAPAGARRHRGGAPGGVHRIWLWGDVGARVTVPLLVGLVPGADRRADRASIPETVVHVVMSVVSSSLARLVARWVKPGGRTLGASGSWSASRARRRRRRSSRPDRARRRALGRAYLGTVAVSRCGTSAGSSATAP